MKTISYTCDICKKEIKDEYEVVDIELKMNGYDTRVAAPGVLKYNYHVHSSHACVGKLYELLHHVHSSHS